ncbi:histidine phosphatase family protein [Nanchangia anserum]|uniref:Histidine phosphatase family protein n=1 Tax=Nanchangia anserum TaxID=2692125 RepID=A0A8I0GCR3_9ACTO|nr:histidine phosphatase family protein [Nanchangia anserum]MBD3689606.1 histidine phosphatase family protein [Nanchangia anserum]QOX81789.1 histidine phosphatase family protein [Nanchangia anserum]
MELIVIRHGQTASNIIDALDTDFPGAPLNAAGLAQAREIPAAWNAAGLGRPDAIIASPLTRTRQTAAPLARAWGIPIRCDDRLREVRAGALEMLYRADAPATYLAIIAAWVRGDLDRRMPGGEVGCCVVGRVDALIRDLASEYGPDSRIALVTHGALTRLYTATRIEGISADLVVSQPVRNCSLTYAIGDVEHGWQARLYSSRPPASWELLPGLRHFRRSVQVIGAQA